MYDLALGGAEDDEPELGVDVDETGAVADAPVAAAQQVVHADAVPDLLDYAVGVLGVDLVFDGVAGALVEFMRWDLD